MANHLDPPYHPNFPEISATCLAIEATTAGNVPPESAEEDHTPPPTPPALWVLYWTPFWRCLERMSNDMTNL
ncbi:hypothetical protein TB1_024094 [Malus domestica]